MACYPCVAAADAEDLIGICETSEFDPDQSQAMPRIRAWTDEEVGRIRVILQRLTALRIRNDDDAEDLVQETLLTATEKLPDGSLHKGLLVWCMGVLRKKVGNYYRKANRFAPLGSYELPARWSQHGEWPVQSPEARLRQTELYALVDRILARFPAQERQPIELYLAGLTAWEIAEELHPERYQNVLNRIFRGRKKLARQLARYGFAPPARRSRGETPSRLVPFRPPRGSEQAGSSAGGPG